MYEGFIDDKQKRAQWEAKQAVDNYARQKEEIDNKYQEKPTGLAGLLSNLTRDIKSTGNTLFTTVSALASPFMQKYTTAANKAAQAKGNEELDKIAQKYGYKDRAEAMDRGDGPDDMWKEMQDISNKTSETVKNISDNFKNNAAVQKVNNTTQSQYGADAIRTLRNAANVMGVGLTPVGGAIGGAAEGFADALENSNGTLVDLQSDLSGGKVKSAVDTNLDWGQAAKNAGVGALTGAVTAGVGNKLGNAKSAIGSKLLNNRVATSAIGRGAIGGAVGGAVGGGLGAGLEGGDVLGGALQGAGSGALTGGVTGGLTSGARKIGTAVTDRLGVTDRVANARQSLMYDPREKVVTDTEPTAKNRTTQSGEQGFRTKTNKERAADALERTGEFFEGVQASLNRTDKKNIGVKNTGKVIDEVRKTTGIGTIAEQADFAKQLTGGEDSILDRFQRNALAERSDGKPFRADTTDVYKKIPEIVQKNITTAGTSTNRKAQLIDSFQRDLLDSGGDLLTLAKNYHNQAAASRRSSSSKEQAEAKVFETMAREIEDASYKAIPQEYVDAIFDASTYELRDMSRIAQQTGDTKAARAYAQTADELENTPHTIKDFRSFKKKFVDVSNIYDKVVENDNTGSTNMARGVRGWANTTKDLLLEKPVKWASAKAGALAVSGADRIRGNGATAPIAGRTSATSQISPDLQNVYNLLGLEIGMNEARSNASDNARNREFKNLEDQLSNTMAEIDAKYGQSTGLDGGYGMAQQNAANSQLIAQMETISGAMNNALAAGDMKAYSQLADLYKDAYDIYKLQNETTSTSQKLSKTQVQANAANDILNQLESMDPDFGYAVRDIPLLNVVNARGNSYSSTADSLATQIGYMLSGANIKDDELEYIKKEFVPQPFDSEEQRRYKLQRARNLIQQYQTAYSDNTVANNNAYTTA